MNNISFEDPEYGTGRTAPHKQSLLTRLTLSSGIAKDERGAQRVMIIIAILAFAASIYFISQSRTHVLTPEEAAKLPIH